MPAKPLSETLTTALRAFFRQHPPPPDAALVVAVSGGPDSLALLHALCALRGELGLRLHAAHLDHTLRGAEAAAEAAFVAETAAAWGVPATVDAADVRALARERRENLHAAGRHARYALLARAAREAGAYAVATAHHADDQAETVLANLLRGAGPAGLSGMLPATQWDGWDSGPGGQRTGATGSPAESAAATPLLLRPLLAVNRADIEAYCAEQGLEPRRDPSNEDRRYRRTRIRADLLPILIEYNPRVVEALGRTAAACADEHAFLEDALASAWPTLARIVPGGVLFAGGAWRALHPALQRAALRRAHGLLAPGETLGLDDAERALAAPGGGVGGRAELPGGVVVTAGYGGELTLSLGEPPAPDGPQLIGDTEALAVPGALALAAGWELRAEPRVAQERSGLWEVYLDAGAVGGRLGVRRRRPGDRLRPAGGRGSRRLQDALLDAKIPRALRERWPIVTIGAAVAWAPGLRPAEGCAANPGSAAVRVWVERAVVPPDDTRP
ncbi:MAG: hypothetical protein RLZZ387_3112 [Chloroflexota bacterium]|jgi:tRNA(Ile)-lysidine synthetase-like protein